MPPCQGPRLTDIALVSPANDNYTPIDLSMKSFEAGSILDPRDYTAPNKMSQAGLTVIAALCVLALAAFIFPLL